MIFDNLSKESVACVSVPLGASCGGGQFRVPAPLEPHALPQPLTCESHCLLLGSACASQLATCTTGKTYSIVLKLTWCTQAFRVVAQRVE